MTMISSNFIFNFTNFSVIVRFLDWKLTVGILFSTAVVLAKLVMSGILLLNSFIIALGAAIVANLVIVGISPLAFFILALREY